MKKQEFPPGWDEKRVKELIANYEDQSVDEEFADIEATREAADIALMAIPTELVPKVRALFAGERSATRDTCEEAPMTGKTETQYQHLEPRPGSNYRTLFLKGRRIRAAVVYEAIHGPEPRSPEEFAGGLSGPAPGGP
jgi:hypothetical protein